MANGLEEAQTLAHGTYDDVIVVEHRQAADGLSTVLEMPEGSRVIDVAKQYEIDGVVGVAAPTVGASYRVIIGPENLRYETLER